MSEKESKEILESLDKAILKMSDFNKGYLLGMSEAMVTKKKEAAEGDKGNKAAG